MRTFLFIVGVACSLALPLSLNAQDPIVFQGHTAAVSSSAFTPDGEIVVTGSFDRSVGIHTVADGKQIRLLQGHKGQVFSVAVSPNGRQAISASRDGTVKKWDLLIPTPLNELAAHESTVQTLAVNTAGTQILTGGADHAARLFNSQDGKLLFELKGHAEAITRSSFHNDDTQAATADAAGVVRLWNTADGASLGAIGAHSAEVTGLAYHPTEPVLLTAADDGVAKLWRLPLTPATSLATQTVEVSAAAISSDATTYALGDAAGNVVLLSAEDGKSLAKAALQGLISKLAFSADSKLVAAASDNGVATVLQAADGNVLHSFRGHAGSVHDVRIHSAANKIATAGADGTIRIWRPTPAATALVGHTLPATAIVGSADGKLIATAGDDKQALVFNTADGKSAATIAGHMVEVSAVDFAPNAATIASASVDGAIRITTVADPTKATSLFGPIGKVTGLQHSADAKTLISAHESGAVTWWNLPPTASLPLAGHTMPIQQVVATPNEASIITGSSDGSIRVFTAATGVAARSLAGQVGPVVSLAATDTIVASGNDAGVIQFWNLADGKDLGSIHGHTGAIASLAFHPGGKQIASAGADGSVRVWNLPTAPASLPGDAMPATTAAFTADRSLTACVGVLAGKPTVMIRTTADGKSKGQLLGHAAAITSVAFSTDKTKVVTGSTDKTARVWDLTDPKFPEIAKFEGHAAAVNAVAFSADGKTVFSAAGNGITQWQIADGMEVRKLAGHTGAITSMEVVGALVVSGSADQTIRTWNAADGKPGAALAHGAVVAAIAVSNDAKQIASGDAAGGVKVFSVTTGKIAATLAGNTSPVKSLAFNAGGDQVVAACTNGLHTWNTTGIARERILLPTAAPTTAAYTTDGKIIAVNAKNELQTHTPSLALVLPGHEGGAGTIAWSLAGDNLFSSGADKTVRRWNATDGKPLAGFAGPTDVVNVLSVSADGKKLIAGGADNNVYVWPIAAATTAATVAEVTLPVSTAVKSLAAGATGGRIAVATDDAWVTIYDTASGQVFERLAGHTMPVSDLAFIGKDAKVVSASADKTSLVHTLNARQLFANEAKAAIVDMQVSADGMWTIIADAKTIRIINSADGAVAFTQAVASPPVAISLRADKTQLAVVSADKKLSLFPLDAKGFGAAVVVELPAAANSLAYHSASNRLAVNCADSKCLLFDSATSLLLEEITLPEAASDVAFLADGMTLAFSGAKGGGVQPTSLELAIAAHERTATGVVFATDGASVISAGADNTVTQWSIADGAKLRSFAPPAAEVSALDMSADGKTLAAVSADKSLTLWDASQPIVAATPTAVLKTTTLPTLATGVSVSANGSRIAVSCDDGVVRVYDSASGLELQRFTQHEGAVNSVAIAADSATVLSGGIDKTLRKSSVAATQIIVADAASVGDAAYLPDGSQFAVTGADMQVKFYDANGAEVKKLSGAAAPLQRIAIRKDATQLAAADSAGNILVWNLADGAVAHTLKTATPISDLNFSDSGEQLVAAGADKHVRVFQTSDATLLQDHELTVAASAAVFSRSGREILLGGDKAVATYTFASTTPVGEFAGHVGAVYMAKFSDDGSLVATCGNDKTVRLFNAETGEALKQFAGHTQAVYSVRFVGGSKQLLTSSADGTARLWDIATGAAVRTFTPPVAEGETPAPLFDAAMNSTGSLIAAAGQNREIYVWNAANGQLAQTMTGHEDAVYQLQFQAARLLSVGQAGNLHVWNPTNGMQASNTKLPGVCYGVGLSPDDLSGVFPCADAKAYLLTLPK